MTCVLPYRSLRKLCSFYSLSPRTVSYILSYHLRGNFKSSANLSCRTRSCLANLRNVHICKTGNQRWWYCSDESFEDSESEEETEDNLFVDEGEYVNLVQDAYGVPHGGHKVLVVQAYEPRKGNRSTTAHLQLEESTALIRSVEGWTVVGTEMFALRNQMKKMLFEKRQLDRLKEKLESMKNVSAVFISVDLLNREQLKGLQTYLGISVLDRYSVVIQIFKEHARTAEAKLQVSMAEVYFLRTRIGEVQEGRDPNNAPLIGGTGEYHLQARHILLRRREKKLRTQIEELKQQRTLLRRYRVKRKIPTVAVIGYTNCGKTTLIKALTGDVRMVPKDQLFATLDVTVHAGYLPNTMTALFVDTVGFISNIPRTLIQAFSATLEDAVLADLVIHVEDVSNPDRQQQRENVMTTVKNMLSKEQMDTMLHVGNKIDKVDISDIEITEDMTYVSAHTETGIDVLRQEIQRRLLINTGLLQKKFRIPLSGDHLSYLYKEATVVSTEEDADQENLIVNIIISPESYEKFRHKYGKKPKRISRPVYQ